jgi:CMP-N,N'-diacetyllegionaminic acid synthase
MDGGVLAIIPARAGSKGVPGKNTRALGAYPLIAYSVVAARLCPEIDRVVVSTDSAAIADLAAAYGAEQPFLRPAEYSGDASPDVEFVVHALDWFRRHEGSEPELIVHLRPTTPLRDPARISEAISVLRASPEATSLRSAHQSHHPVQKMFALQDEYFVGLFPDDRRPDYFNLPRQSFPPSFEPNGYVDIYRTRVVRQGCGLHGDRMRAFVTEFCGEVDSFEDLDILEFVLSRRGHGLHDYLRTFFPLPRSHTARPVTWGASPEPRMPSEQPPV